MTNRLYVGNLAFHTTEDVIQKAFAECGEVSEVKLVIDRETGRSRGFAFVQMSTAEGAFFCDENWPGCLVICSGAAGILSIITALDFSSPLTCT